MITNFKEVIMKKTQIIIVCVVAISIFVSGTAFADSQRRGHGKSFGYKRHANSSGLLLLARYQQKNLMLLTLAEMTGQSAEAIKLKLEDQGRRSLMQELNVDRQAFYEAMQAKIKTRINQAVGEGTITPEQEKEILAKMETRSKRRFLMRKLIEKGIEDGTITQEEAGMLMRKRH
jgi:hypothetical protein